MHGRGRLLVNMVLEKGKENVSLNAPPQYEELQPVIISVGGDGNFSRYIKSRDSHSFT